MKQVHRPRLAKTPKYRRDFVKEAVLYLLRKYINQKKLDFNNIY